MEVKLIRYEHSKNQGNRGFVLIDDVFFGYSIECPDKNNKKFVSRIPAGTYTAKQKETKSFGCRWVLENVKDRTYIIFGHVGNTKKNFKGCIGIGKSLDYFYKINERGVTSTENTCNIFMYKTGKEEELTIKIIEV